MKKPVNIYLVGPMGVGKSTIGKELAKKMQFEFVDSDTVIEQSSGVAIAWIFDVEGEEGFRRREISAIEHLTKKQGIVLATGGGTVLEQENRTRLASRGTVVYLTASIEQLLKRTLKDKKRPLLQDKENRESIMENLHEQRDPLYREVADLVVTTEGRSIRSVADFILKKLEQPI